MSSRQLLSVEAEEAACREAFDEAVGVAYAWHIHHDVVAERLTFLPGARITCILMDKPVAERALRLHLFRPVQNERPIRRAEYHHDRAIRAAGVAFDRETELAWATYNDALDGSDIHAGDAEWAAFCDVRAAAEFHRVTAIDAARRAFDEAVAAAHAAECPDCPWDGVSIFQGGR